MKAENRKKLSGAMLAASAGMFLLAAAATADTTTTTTTVQKADYVKCFGANGCKGQGACATAKNACAGKNGCKGQAWIKVANEEECTKKGGTTKEN